MTCLARKPASRIAGVALIIIAGLSLPAHAQGSRTYRDPDGRFTLTIPAGWNAAPAKGGVVVTRGNASAVFSPFDGATGPQQIVAALAAQYGAQWRNLSRFDAGEFQIGGQPAAYAMYTGVSPRGAESLLRVAGVGQGREAFAIIISVPREEFNAASPTLQAIESSFAFAGEQAGPVSRDAIARDSRPAAPGHYYRLKWARLMDPSGFGQPVEVARFLIPADWQFQGEVRWGPATGCTANLIHLSGRATSTDGTSAFEIFDPYSWQWHDDPMNQQTGQQMYNTYAANPALRPCEMRPAQRAADFIRQAIVARARPGSQIVGAEPLPQVAQARKMAAQNEYAALLQSGAVRSIEADAGKVMLSYQMNGHRVEEWITGTVEIAALPTPSASAAMRGGSGYVNMYSIRASNLFGLRAPAGELESQSRLYATMVGSFRANPAWAAAAMQVLSNVTTTAAQESAKRAAIWREAQQQMGDMITSQYRAQQAVQDRLASAYSQSARGTETFVDPTTREHVELTGGFRQVWSNGHGEYILSDDPNFNPAVTLRENWVEMSRAGGGR